MKTHRITRITLRSSVAVLLMALSSCTVTRRSISTIYFPDNSQEKEVASSATSSSNGTVTPEMTKLASHLSKSLPFTVDADDDIELYTFVADWLGTPYRFGSMSKRGTDCSGFVYNLYQDVYEGGFKRSSAADIMKGTKRVKKGDLQEGDLVFFNIRNRRGGRASHVGVYLKDGRFVHASTRYGVIISSLSEPYYRRTYLGAGRVR